MALSEKFIAGLLSLNDPASQQVELFRLYYDPINEPSSYYPMCSSSNGYGGAIFWQGVQYNPLPIEFENLETSILDRMQRPKLRISNEGLLISQILRKKNDLKDAKIARVRTQIRFIDDNNFDGGENPFGSPDPTQEIVDTFVVSQKLGENRQIVEFECTAPFDVTDFTVPARSVSPRYCNWQYRGCGCNFWGPPVKKEDGSAFPVAPINKFNFQSSEFEWQYGKAYAAGSIAYVPTNKDPFRTYFVANENHTSNEVNQPSINSLIWSKDGCQKTIQACHQHHVATGIAYTGNVTIPNPLSYGLLESEKYLPFGGFPATDKYSKGTQ
jgi:lambda family phage minor tail protein L